MSASNLRCPTSAPVAVCPPPPSPHRRPVLTPSSRLSSACFVSTPLSLQRLLGEVSRLDTYCDVVKDKVAKLADGEAELNRRLLRVMAKVRRGHTVCSSASCQVRCGLWPGVGPHSLSKVWY